MKFEFYKEIICTLFTSINYKAILLSESFKCDKVNSNTIFIYKRYCSHDIFFPNNVNMQACPRCTRARRNDEKSESDVSHLGVNKKGERTMSRHHKSCNMARLLFCGEG